MVAEEALWVPPVFYFLSFLLSIEAAKEAAGSARGHNVVWNCMPESTGGEGNTLH